MNTNTYKYSNNAAESTKRDDKEGGLKYGGDSIEIEKGWTRRESRRGREEMGRDKIGGKEKLLEKSNSFTKSKTGKGKKRGGKRGIKGW